MKTTGSSYPVRLRTRIETWPLRRPIRITGSTIREFPVLVVCLERAGIAGCGEAMGVHYRSDDPPGMRAQIESLRSAIEAGEGRAVLEHLPAGGARNALDCAWWDLESREAGQPVWRLAGLPAPRPLTTTYTIGSADPGAMAESARGWRQARALKLKLTGDAGDADRVRSVRHARPDVWLGVDANQGFTPAFLDSLVPTLVGARVALLEQPFPASNDAWLDDLDCPIPVAADESVQHLRDLDRVGTRWDAINIKLDKCGGLTEAIAMAKAVRGLGLRPMIGTMGGTSLAMSPAFLVGQLCDLVDLDAPVFLGSDRSPAALYRNGSIWCPAGQWGSA